MTKRVLLAVASSFVLAIAGCGGDDDDDTNTNGNGNANGNTNGNGNGNANNNNGNGNGSTCTGQISVTFMVNDVNGSYGASDGMAWKGSFDIDAASNTLSLDTAWGAPYPLMFDDGTNGDMTAGDNIWSRMVMVDVPAEGSGGVSFEHGLIRGSTPEADGVSGSDGEWIWVGANGTFTVPECASSNIELPLFNIPAWGTNDLLLTVDYDGELVGTWDPGTGVFADGDILAVKGPAMAGWESPVQLVDDGTNGDVTADDGIYSISTSAVVGPGTDAPHNGLHNSGDNPEFIFVRLRDAGGGEFVQDEYKDAGVASTVGVQAFVTADGGTPTMVTVEINSGNNNTFVAIP